ncbi:MAG: DUF4974 domain-containing protein [Candidatus Pseudobacter hemicellulosilyticus]|uniref:DUF4974 domain-containing protein n=1 Tax=Candidatus Pseudobacter hemicellulosilyticus TaxID=3121375 RepID=A0AAJ5WVT0_9BACT|nr:MAG: DUF4974 domain-containing protein [Pseudobacter sp.]
MTERAQYIARLTARLLNDQLSAAEKADLEQWASESLRHAGILKDISSAESIAGLLKEVYTYPVNRMEERLQAEFPGLLLGDSNGQDAGQPETGPVVHRIHFLRKWGWAAAAVLVLLCVGLFFLVINDNKKAAAPMVVQGIPPGRDGAVLTLADGRQVSLDSLENGIVALQGGAVARVQTGKLIYEARGKEVVYNTMTTPKGRQYQLTLPDGTKVWLNAASSIRFPTVFTGNERKVEITGEAYFIVEKDPGRPFLVDVRDKMEVAVLGTDFNISAYDNDEAVSATLLKGSIQVNVAGIQGQPGPLLLEPGQQVQLITETNRRSEAGLRLVRSVDTDKVIAWKNGLFNFDDAPLSAVLRQLERWYNIRVVYQPPAKEVTFKGKIYRNINLSDALKVLEIMEVNFELKGDTLYVNN